MSFFFFSRNQVDALWLSELLNEYFEYAVQNELGKYSVNVIFKN